MGEALRIANGEWPVQLQQPTSFYYPGLPQRAWYEPGEFAWAEAVEAAAETIRAEAEAVLAQGAGIAPYVTTTPDRASRGHSLLDDPRWSAFHLWRDGAPVPAQSERCPAAMAALAQTPMPRIAGRSPMALFSILRPGTHITPHHGMLNTRLICHLPLIVPPGCRLRVGNEVREVEAGKLMIFDDSMEHEAWNDGPSVRVILLFEIWRPELDDAEIAALTAMYQAIGNYPAS
jgi:aspartyl/asparaginyl beta-hydroxylase (cupin superfamily)